MLRPPEGNETVLILKMEVKETPLKLILRIENMGVITETEYDNFEQVKVALLNNIVGLTYTLF